MISFILMITIFIILSMYFVIPVVMKDGSYIGIGISFIGYSASMVAFFAFSSHYVADGIFFLSVAYFCDSFLRKRYLIEYLRFGYDNELRFWFYASIIIIGVF